MFPFCFGLWPSTPACEVKIVFVPTATERVSWGGVGGLMDRFSFFFAFYGLLLGLAVAEQLTAFGAFVRARGFKGIEPQTGLLSLFVFICICATWLDAWASLRTVTLNFAGLAGPVLVATGLYLVASVVFPREAADFDAMADYYARRKRFVVGLLLALEFVVNLTFLHVFRDALQHHPAVFWGWHLPYNVAIKLAYIGLFFARSRRANIAFIILLLALFLLPYWENGWVAATIQARFG
jgi:hypothetical protein